MQTTALGDDGVQTTRYWLYAPGEDACMWEQFYECGVMGLGWRQLGDLSVCVSKKDVKISLGSDFSALCVDMESGAVAQVCTRLGKGFLIIRSISDSITDESGMEYNKFVELAAKNSKKLVKEILR